MLYTTVAEHDIVTRQEPTMVYQPQALGAVKE
jgi:hypothetical protein